MLRMQWWKMVCEECLLRQLAAFVDGEGTIGIRKHKDPSGCYVYQQGIQVANTDIRLIYWLVENFGGKFPKVVKDDRENRKDWYAWRLSSYNSYKIIKNIIPYLLLKQEQADNAIKLYEKVSKWKYGGSHPRPEHKTKLCEELYQKNRKLNMRGKVTNVEVEVLVPVKIRKDVLDEWL